MPQVLIVLFIRVICYGSFSLLFKFINLTRFILELITELTLSQRKWYAQHTNLLHIGVFVKIANAESVQSKLYRVLSPILPETTQFEQKTG